MTFNKFRSAMGIILFALGGCAHLGTQNTEISSLDGKWALRRMSCKGNEASSALTTLNQKIFAKRFFYLLSIENRTATIEQKFFLNDNSDSFCRTLFKIQLAKKPTATFHVMSENLILSQGTASAGPNKCQAPSPRNIPRESDFELLNNTELILYSAVAEEVKSLCGNGVGAQLIVHFERVL